MKRTGITDSDNSVSFLTEYASITAIVESDGDILLVTSDDVRPTLTLDQLTLFYGAVKALHDELNTGENKHG